MNAWQHQIRKIKVLVTGQGEPRKARSGKTSTPTRMVDAVRALASGWDLQRCLDCKRTESKPQTPPGLFGLRLGPFVEAKRLEKEVTRRIDIWRHRSFSKLTFHPLSEATEGTKGDRLGVRFRALRQICQAAEAFPIIVAPFFPTEQN